MRKVHFLDKTSCEAALKAVLECQGYESALDLYEIEGEISHSSGTAKLFRAVHKITGVQVVIKSIDRDHYKSKMKMLEITEATAMHLCRDSQNVTPLHDYIKLDDKVHIVTKLAKGGDLASYL